MSHDATAWAKAQKTGSTSAKFILMILADYAGTDYSCYPSVKKLADLAEMGESTVRAATKLLAEQGLIRVYYRHKSSGLRRSCRYQLLIDGPETMEPETDDWASYRQIPAGDNRQDSAVDTPDLSASARQISADIPIKEPSLKNEPPVLISAASQPRATRVPEDFEPDEGMRAWYVAEKIAEAGVDGRIEHQKFMNYWLAQPGVKGRKLDWRRTWMNWMLTAAERAPRRPAGNSLVPVSGAPLQYDPNSTTNQRVVQGLALADKFRQIEENQ